MFTYTILYDLIHFNAIHPLFPLVFSSNISGEISHTARPAQVMSGKDWHFRAACAGFVKCAFKLVDGWENVQQGEDALNDEEVDETGPLKRERCEFEDVVGEQSLFYMNKSDPA